MIASRRGVRRIAAAVCLAAVAFSANAAGRGRIRALNVSIQPLFVLLSAAIQGHLKSASDALRCAGSGVVAGYGFYEAKAVAGRQRITEGWAIGNVASSISRNAASGLNPLARLGFAIGPFRVDVTTPLEPNSYAAVHLSGSITEVGALVDIARKSDRVTFANGMIQFRKNGFFDGTTDVDGLTSGIYPSVSAGTTRDVLAHETIHALQALQMDSVEPPTWKVKSGRFTIVRFDRIDTGFVQFANALATRNTAYENEWGEIEAYRLAEHMAPPRCGQCN